MMKMMDCEYHPDCKERVLGAAIPNEPIGLVARVPVYAKALLTWVWWLLLLLLSTMPKKIEEDYDLDWVQVAFFVWHCPLDDLMRKQ